MLPPGDDYDAHVTPPRHCLKLISASSVVQIRCLIKSVTEDGRAGCDLTVNASISVLISFSDHLVNLVVRQLLTDRSHDMSQFRRRNEPVIVAVEDFECLPNLFF